MFFLLIVVLVLVVPVAVFYATRVAINRTVDAARVIAAEDGALQNRLARIEDAIDAMAVEIERLAEHQRLPASRPEAEGHEPQA